MKSWIAAFTATAFVANMAVAVAAQPTSTTTGTVVSTGAGETREATPYANAKPDAGGITPCLLECYIGPRVGAEYNEGRNFATLEILQIIPYIGGIFRIILAAQAYQGKTMTEYAKENALDSRPIPGAKGGNASKGGITGCLISCYLGPRVGFEHNEGRKVRTYDILRIVIIGGILEGLEAYNGKTMTQIVKDEQLDG